MVSSEKRILKGDYTKNKSKYWAFILKSNIKKFILLSKLKINHFLPFIHLSLCSETDFILKTFHSPCRFISYPRDRSLAVLATTHQPGVIKSQMSYISYKLSYITSTLSYMSYKLSFITSGLRIRSIFGRIQLRIRIQQIRSYWHLKNQFRHLNFFTSNIFILIFEWWLFLSEKMEKFT